MKKSQQIIGLPIISISEGNEVGKVKNIVINADRGTIDYFVVDSGIQVLSTRVIPTANVLGIGEYAMTILNPEAISDISKLPDAIDMLQKNITVKDTKVLTKKGSLIGETGDIYVNVDKQCSIAGVEYIADITQKKIRIIPRESVITFGKTLMVVEDDVQNRLLDDPSELAAMNGIELEKKNDGELPVTGDLFEESPADEELVLDLMEAESADVSEPSEPEVASQEQKSTAAELFEERQRNYLKGRKATKNIADNQGMIFIRAGETITDSVLDRAKSSGKLIELVKNNEA
ncbi:MAG: hypothetical protein GX144_12860 [Clostridiaceae bacterium]|nr:hypothetical protein [Clostridiaceae bacterium]